MVCGISCFGKSQSQSYTLSAASAAHQPLPQPLVDIILACYDNNDFRGSSDALTAWLNARWQKTGISVSKEVVCFTLRLNGRDARMGLGDHLEGAFYRPLPAAEPKVNRSSLRQWIDGVLSNV